MFRFQATTQFALLSVKSVEYFDLEFQKYVNFKNDEIFELTINNNRDSFD